jgi:hypothetical protein
MERVARVRLVVCICTDALHTVVWVLTFVVNPLGEEASSLRPVASRAFLCLLGGVARVRACVRSCASTLTSYARFWGADIRDHHAAVGASAVLPFTSRAFNFYSDGSHACVSCRVRLR